MNGDEVGFVVEAKQYVLTLSGLPSARVHDIIVGDSGRRAIIRSLAGEHVTALSLDGGSPRAGDRYRFLADQRLYALGDHLFGRVVNTLGEPVDGGDPFPPGNTELTLDVDAPGVEARAPIAEMLHTGVVLIDALLPIAKGQRQLLYGAVKGGKTDLLADIVLNQRRFNTVCIYAIIGKSLSELERIERRVLTEGVGTKIILLAALSDQPSSRIALAPSVAFLIADHFQRQGQDVLVVLDDLDVHAKYLREIALLESKLPGRESYPGDLFYEHAHLLERSGRFNETMGGGSITALPVIETDPAASLGIVSTNLMSCTDGHFAFITTLEREGVYPAISEEQSITRIGRSAQGLLQKQLSWEVRMLLANGRRQRGYAAFGTPVARTVEAMLHQCELIEVLMRQTPGKRIPAEIQVPLLALTFTAFLRERDGTFVASNRERLIEGLGTDQALKGLTTLALSETPLADYLRKVEAARPAFERLCHA